MARPKGSTNKKPAVVVQPKPRTKWLIWNHFCDNLEGGKLFDTQDQALGWVEEQGYDVDEITLVEVSAVYDVMPSKLKAELADLDDR